MARGSIQPVHGAKKIQYRIRGVVRTNAVDKNSQRMIIWAEDAPSVVNFGCYQRQNQKVVVGKTNARTRGDGQAHQPNRVGGKENAQTTGDGNITIVQPD